MHARQQIRQALLPHLQKLPQFGGRVFASRVLPLDPARLGGPCLLLFCHDEPRIEVESCGQPGMQSRSLELVLRMVAKADLPDLDDQLDDCLLACETALAAAGDLAGRLPAGLQLASVQVGIDESLEQPLGVLQLICLASYRVHADRPDQII